MKAIDEPPSQPEDVVVKDDHSEGLERWRIGVAGDRGRSRRHIRAIIRSYQSFIIRWYSRIRFLIMRLRILEELDQYIPREGSTVDLGCGFGLFSLYFASQYPTRSIVGIDLNKTRIEAASRSADLLGLTNVKYIVGDAVEQQFPDELACVYTLDLLHHVPAQGVKPLLQTIHHALAAEGVLLVKDVDTHPVYKRWFTLLLDRVMVGWEPIRYWSAAEMIGMLEDVGFQVYTHELRDVLPYPHRLYICRKRAGSRG